MWQSKLETQDTIFALTTGSLPSAVAIVRVSGPEAFRITEKIFIPRRGVFSRCRQMWLGRVVDLREQRIDEAMVLSFVGPDSHSGDDTIEFHLHGSLSVVRRLQELLLQLGARTAVRGEFSYRAFLNGKMTAAELDTLGDVYLARQTADLEQLYARKDESLTATIEVLRAQLIRLQAILDTAIDFSDEYSSVLSAAFEPIEAAIRGCSAITQRYSMFRSGGTTLRISLVGRPNAGKSSLFNAFLGRYRAIVHSMPGTTRDAIEEDVTIEGRSWKIVDTAGVRTTDQFAEQEGLKIGDAFLKASHAWVLVVDGSSGLGAEDRALLDRFGHVPHLVLWNKCDLVELKSPPDGALLVSAKLGTGLPAVWQALQALLGMIRSSEDGPLPSATESGRLEKVLGELEGLRLGLKQGNPPEFLAEESRKILGSLESVLGPVSPEEILDRVFRDFCIGK